MPLLTSEATNRFDNIPSWHGGWGYANVPVQPGGKIGGSIFNVNHAAVAGDIGGVWEYLKSLEPQAVELLFSLLGRLVQKR